LNDTSINRKCFEIEISACLQPGYLHRIGAYGGLCQGHRDHQPSF
jgi:hypothetical protein